MSDALKTEIWRRLRAGGSLNHLNLPHKDGRIDLSRTELTEPKIVKRWQNSIADITETEPVPVLRGVTWENLDLSNSVLPSLHFFGSQIKNCKFDRCQMPDLRIFDTAVRDSSFRDCNLNNVALGTATGEGPFKGHRNVYTNVDFTRADLRETAYVAASFEHCVFNNTKLVKIDFGTSVFKDCQFAGELREVIFWHSDLFTRGISEDLFPPNEMLNIDFTRAKLRWVEFRGLTLNQVNFPLDEDHLVLDNYDSILENLIHALRKENDQTARMLVGALEIDRKWAVPNGRGILNKRDLAEMGSDAIGRVSSLLDKLRAIN